MLFSSSSASFAVGLLLTQWLHSTIAAQCYYSDGSKADASFQPCFPDQENSPCCAINKPKNMANDICLTSGLCMAQMQGYSGLLYQNGCTDPTGKSSQCQTVCSGPVNSGIHLLPCPAKGNDQWCCSTNGTDCCDYAGTVDIGTIYGYTSTSATSTSTSTTTGTATGTRTGTIATTTVTTTAAAGNGTEVCTDSSSKTTAVGAGVGAGLGACLVATLFALWFQRRMYQRKLQQSGGYAGYGPANMEYAQSMPSSGQPVVSELHSDQGVIHEVDGTERRK